MLQDLINLLEAIKTKIGDDSDVSWTGYEQAMDLRNELDAYISQLKSGDSSCLNEIHIHFLPTSTFQEHSVSNGWMDEYIRLSERFDALYLAITQQD